MWRTRVVYKCKYPKYVNWFISKKNVYSTKIWTSRVKYSDLLYALRFGDLHCRWIHSDTSNFQSWTFQSNTGTFVDLWYSSNWASLGNSSLWYILNVQTVLAVCRLSNAKTNSTLTFELKWFWVLTLLWRRASARNVNNSFYHLCSPPAIFLCSYFSQLIFVETQLMVESTAI